MLNHSVKPKIIIYEIGEEFGAVFSLAFLQSNIRCGFLVSGIFIVMPITICCLILQTVTYPK